MVANRFSERTMMTTNRFASASSVRRRLAHEEGGQVLMLTGIMMVLLLVCVALVIDIAHAQLVQRQLQAGVDSAALAAAQELPEADLARETADAYSPTPGKKNAVNTVDNATTTVDVRCITTIPGCNTRYADANAVTVESSARVPTFFGRIVGIDSLTVKARATACFPCSVRPLDIMIVLDRTGSMCDSDGDDRYATPPRCTELSDAKAGVEAFLSVMDPKLDRVGLALTPPTVGQPARSGRNGTDDPCQRPTDNNNWFGFDAWAPWWDTGSGTGYQNGDRAFYVVASLSDDDVPGDPAGDDYLVEDSDGNWNPNPNSPLISALNCAPANGSTSYAVALAEAQHELTVHGRPNAPDVIVFFTDGGANVTPNTGGELAWMNSSTWKYRPCGTAVEEAKRLPGDTAIYTIGYGLTDETDRKQRCNQPESNGHSDFNNAREVTQNWGYKPTDALKAIATSAPGTNSNFYYTANSDQLRQLFRKVAGDVLTNAARLVTNDQPNLMQ